VVLEIGFGMGDTTAHIAKAMPDKDFIGVEVHTPGVGSLLKQIGEQGIDQPAPDPARRGRSAEQHDRRRLAGRRAHLLPGPVAQGAPQQAPPDPAAFVKLLCEKLAPGGYLHCATDWEDYAVQMLEVLGAEPACRTRPRAMPRSRPTVR
jgi:tRNA (guanine-N7-)-methyltransferase